MDYFKQGGSYYHTFVISDADGALADGSGRTATAIRNNVVDNDFALTLTKLEDGVFTISGTVPDDYEDGDVICVLVKATVSSEAAGNVVDKFIVGDLYADLAARVFHMFRPNEPIPE